MALESGSRLIGIRSRLRRAAAARPLPVLAAMTLLVGCLGSGMPRSVESTQVWIQLPVVREHLVLEVAGQAWEFRPADGGGVISTDVADAVRAHLRDASSCDDVIAFDVEPGHKYVVQFAADNSSTVRDATNEAFPMGPGVESSPTNPCGGAIVPSRRARV